MTDLISVMYTTRQKAMAPIHVLQAGAITKGQKGKELADIEFNGSGRSSGNQ